MNTGSSTGIHLIEGALTWPCFTVRTFSPPSGITITGYRSGIPILSPTRDILYVKGFTNGGDSLHLLINHWPSRWEGMLESKPERLAAAGILQHILDSLFLADKQSRILVAGDFNDEVTNASLRDSLQVQHPVNRNRDDGLYFPCDSPLPGGPGSLKYRGRWYGFDLILVSGTLLTDTGLSVRNDGFQGIYTRFPY